MASSSPSSSGALAASGSRPSSGSTKIGSGPRGLEAGQQRLRGRVALERGTTSAGSIGPLTSPVSSNTTGGGRRRSRAVTKSTGVGASAPRPRRHERVLALLAAAGTSRSPGTARRGWRPRSACRSGSTACRSGRTPPRPRGCRAAVVRRRLVEVGPQERAGRRPAARVGCPTSSAPTGVNGCTLAGPQHLALVDVADAGRDALVEQQPRPPWLGSSQNWGMRCHALGDVDVRVAQVGPEAARRPGWSAKSLAR